jgi:hypothetical protein
LINHEGSPETVAVLVRTGADLNIVGNGGQIPVDWAAMSVTVEIVLEVSHVSCSSHRPLPPFVINCHG